MRLNFLGRVGYGFCLGLGCPELRVFLSFRSPLGLRCLALGCGRLSRTPGGFSYPSFAGCLFLCLSRLGLRLLVLDRLALGRFLCRCCLLCSGRRTPLPARGGVGCCCLLSFFGLSPVRRGGPPLPVGDFSFPSLACCFFEPGSRPCAVCKMIPPPRSTRCDNLARGCTSGSSDFGPALIDNMAPGPPVFLLSQLVGALTQERKRLQQAAGEAKRAAQAAQSGCGAGRAAAADQGGGGALQRRPRFLRAGAAQAHRLGRGRPVRARRPPQRGGPGGKGGKGCVSCTARCRRANSNSN